MSENKNRGVGQPSQTSGPRKPARVLIVDDHPLLRKAVRALLDEQSDMTSCGEAGSANEAREQVDVTHPDLVIVDISLPQSSGIELIRDLKVRYPEMLVLVLSMHDERLYAERALRAGASGYVMKQEPPERLLEGLRSVLKGDLFVSQRLSSLMLNAFVNSSPSTRGRTGMELLSDRELQVFEDIGGGLSTQQIGRKQGISPKTVETYRSHIKRKLGLNDGNGLVHAAVCWLEREAAGKTGAGQNE